MRRLTGSAGSKPDKREWNYAEACSNNPRAYALERARQAGIEGICVSPRQYETRDLFNQALLEALQAAEPDLIVLAGFLVAIPPAVIEAFRGRIINIHPALIPSFCGKGYYGLKVHERALERGVKVSGATVHFVDEGLDSGPIILQKAVEILDGDTAEVLQKRIMEQAEWIILPRAISLIAQGRVVIEGRTTRILPEIGVMEFDRLTAFAKEKDIDLTVISMDDPLCAGIADAFEAAGLRVFGTRKNAAIIEGSKAFSKDLMKKYGIPTAAYEIFDDAEKALAYLETSRYPIVLKASGLALGKGVLICEDRSIRSSAPRATRS